MTTYSDTSSPTDIMAELGLSINSTFIPFSQSRHAGDAERLSYTAERLSYKGQRLPPIFTGPCLNWLVTLNQVLHSDKPHPILSTPYSAGAAYCPSYEPGTNTLDYWSRINRECETGRGEKDRIRILPNTLDVMYGLISDSNVLNYSTYENWAYSTGYDSDSRKGEAMYRVCLDIGLKMRNGLGEVTLARLVEAFQEY